MLRGERAIFFGDAGDVGAGVKNPGFLGGPALQGGLHAHSRLSMRSLRVFHSASSIDAQISQILPRRFSAGWKQKITGRAESGKAKRKQCSALIRKRNMRRFTTHQLD